MPSLTSLSLQQAVALAAYNGVKGYAQRSGLVQSIRLSVVRIVTILLKERVNVVVVQTKPLQGEAAIMLVNRLLLLRRQLGNWRVVKQVGTVGEDFRNRQHGDDLLVVDSARTLHHKRR
jgi:hypothetical protein